MALIELRGVTKRYIIGEQEILALNGIDLFDLYTNEGSVEVDDKASKTIKVTFDFTASLPQGAVESDFEGETRVGNTLYVEGSMSNNSSGVPQPARSLLLAATILSLRASEVRRVPAHDADQGVATRGRDESRAA